MSEKGTIGEPGTPGNVYYYVEKGNYAKALEYAQCLYETDSVRFSENYLLQWSYDLLKEVPFVDNNVRDIKTKLRDLGYGRQLGQAMHKTDERRRGHQRSRSPSRSSHDQSRLIGPNEFGLSFAMSAVTQGSAQEGPEEGPAF
jgi:hypothetical protein